jgi:hypothetical protein
MAYDDEERAQERNALRAKIENLGVGIKDIDAVTDHLLSAHKLAYVVHHQDDDRLRALVMQSKGERPDLFVGGAAPTSLPVGVTPELAKLLTPGELKLWPSLPLFKRLCLMRNAQDRSFEDRITLADELKVKGITDVSQMTPDQKMRLAHAVPDPAQPPGKVALSELPPGVRGLKGQALLGAMDAHRELRRVENEIAHLSRKTKADLPTFNLQLARDQLVRNLEAKRDRILERHPFLRVA